MQSQVCNVYICKWKEQYYVFSQNLFIEPQGPFHTSELAHLWLIERAKKMSNENLKIHCLDVEREFVFVGEKIES